MTLRQIIEHAERAQELCRGRSAHELAANWQVAMAFERAMEIMGEAVKRLPDELRAKHPGVPWRQIAGMRDRLSHGYDSIDYELLCNAVMNARSETRQWSSDAHVRSTPHTSHCGRGRPSSISSPHSISATLPSFPF